MLKSQAVLDAGRDEGGKEGGKGGRREAKQRDLNNGVRPASEL